MDVSFRVGEAGRIASTVRKLRKNGGLGVEAKMLHEGAVVPMASEKKRGGSWVFMSYTSEE